MKDESENRASVWNNVEKPNGAKPFLPRGISKEVQPIPIYEII
ncbi:hypothetical protein [Proteiniphilum sp. UBA5384]|nr:hypothetical protein [Proteiniphilum sp. UBA5384]